jgi:hypothetical protein
MLKGKLDPAKLINLWILNAQWIVGFVDGEGCFHIGINQNQEMKLGVQVLPEFTVVQHQVDEQVLYALKAYFGCGVVRKNHGSQTLLSGSRTPKPTA